MLNFMVLLNLSLELLEQWSKLGAALIAVVAVFFAAWGISRIGVKALESIARQPEAGNDIRSSMIVAAALIEGVTFFCIVVCLLILFV